MSQVNETRQLQTTQIQKAFRAAMVMFGATVVVAAVYGYLGFVVINAWQLVWLTAVIAAFGVLTLISAAVIKAGKPTLGVWLMIVGMYIIFPVASALIAGMGLVLGASVILLTAALAMQLLPQRQATWAIVIGAIVGIVTFLLDSPELDYRLPVPPQLQIFISVVTGLVVIIFIFFVARRFADFSLRTKLILAFLSVSVLSVGTVIFFTNRSTSAVITREFGGNLRSLADTQALSLGDLVARQLDTLQLLSLNKIIGDTLPLVNARYGTDLSAIQADLQSTDDQWKLADIDDSFLVQPRLRNAVATELGKFQDLFPDHINMLVTDKYGGIVGTTHYIPDYVQANKEWWQKANNLGNGALFIGAPRFDEETDSVVIDVALPIYNNEDKVIGVLKSAYSLAVLSDLIQAVANEPAGLHADLFLPPNLILEDNGQLETMPPGVVERLNATALEPYSEFDFEGVVSLVSQSPVFDITDKPIVNDLGWRFIAHQDRDIALAPIQTQNRNTLIIGLLITIFGVMAGAFMAYLLSNPIVKLTEVVQRITGGDLSSRAEVNSADEVGILAANFNTMADQLGKTIDTLEDSVTARTRQLETVVDVGQQFSSILDLNDLMREVVILTKETFNYYHAHIYLLDEATSTLIMAEGYGEAGDVMKQQEHSILVTAPKSLVARAARESRSITVENVRNDPDWLPNLLLPDTYSEMAVPVILRGSVVGVLDVQSDQIGGLTAQDEATLRALANQIASAVDNARTFSETQEALNQAQKLQRVYTGDAWRQMARQTTDYEVRQPNQVPLEQISTPEVNTVLQQKQTVNLRIGSAGNGSDQNNEAAPDMIASLATPLKLRNQIVGVLGIRDESNPNRHWTEDEIALIEAVSEQMSLAIENARLFENTRRSAWRDQMVSESTAQVWSSVEIEEVMRTAVAQLGDKLRASEVVIRLGTESDLEEEGIL